MSWVIVGWVEARNPTNQPDIYKCDCEALPTGDREAGSQRESQFETD
ncbi:hypothetical protein [Cylindrospermopsis raciborskii]|nr:hypothetical protein [Cylindrospermopsis raciborskii]